MNSPLFLPLCNLGIVNRSIFRTLKAQFISLLAFLTLQLVIYVSISRAFQGQKLLFVFVFQDLKLPGTFQRLGECLVDGCLWDQTAFWAQGPGWEKGWTHERGHSAQGKARGCVAGAQVVWMDAVGDDQQLVTLILHNFLFLVFWSSVLMGLRWRELRELIGLAHTTPWPFTWCELIRQSHQHSVF